MLSDKEKIEKEKKIDFGLVEIFDRYELWEDENAEEIMDELEDLLQSQKQEWVKEKKGEIEKIIELGVNSFISVEDTGIEIICDKDIPKMKKHLFDTAIKIIES